MGAVLQLHAKGRNKIIVLATEHAAVRDTALAYVKQGFDVQLHPVQSNGLVDLDALDACIDSKTALVGAMLVNNEIGVIQPVEAIADLAHARGALMLCDAVQGYGRVKIPANIDMAAVSAHKIYGPKGIGGLWVRNDVKIPSLIHGGGQEQSVRSGTLSPALCAGMGVAASLCISRAENDTKHIEALAKHSLQLFSDWTVNGSRTHRYPGNLNIRRKGLDVARLMSDVRGVAFSAGSACASGSGRPSHVLTAIGLESTEVKSSIRLGFGRYNSLEDIEMAANLINKAAEAQ
jgi:cysteine desulfurase